MNKERDTLLNSAAAAGVDIIVVSATGSPLSAIAKDTGTTELAPVGRPTLAPKVILNLALHWLVIPLKVTKPLPSLWRIHWFPLTAVLVNTTLEPAATVYKAFAVISMILPP